MGESGLSRPKIAFIFADDALEGNRESFPSTAIACAAFGEAPAFIEE
ncbi:MAG: hypothetical protein JOY97_01515 [Hyphomicrobiales bacterium]|nr:hypothetical protein [Hyphomicrobiales bacterium]